MIQRPTKLKSFALLKNFSTSFARKNRFIFVQEVRWGVHSEVRPVYGHTALCSPVSPTAPTTRPPQVCAMQIGLDHELEIQSLDEVVG
jgi:hypothetical protein